VYQFLADGVMLNTYLWSIAFIIMFIALDRLANSVLLSKELEINEDTYLFAWVIRVFSFVSFKTTLYLFYTFVLIASRISILEPALISTHFQRFVFSIEYCLILVVTFDKYSEYLLKDNQRIKKISAKFSKFTNFVAKQHKKRKEKRQRKKKKK